MSDLDDLDTIGCRIVELIIRVVRKQAARGAGGMMKDLVLAHFDGENDPRDESAAILDAMIADGSLLFDGTFVRMPLARSLTASTITDEQISALWTDLTKNESAGVPVYGVMECVVALGLADDVSEGAKHRARCVCAALLNTRANPRVR